MPRRKYQRILFYNPRLQKVGKCNTKLKSFIFRVSWLKKVVFKEGTMPKVAVTVPRTLHQRLHYNKIQIFPSLVPEYFTIASLNLNWWINKKSSFKTCIEFINSEHEISSRYVQLRFIRTVRSPTINEMPVLQCRLKGDTRKHGSS